MHLGVFREDRRTEAVDVPASTSVPAFWSSFARNYAHLGGLDHVLFLLTLILPAPLVVPALHPTKHPTLRPPARC